MRGYPRQTNTEELLQLGNIYTGARGERGEGTGFFVSLRELRVLQCKKCFLSDLDFLGIGLSNV